MALVPVSTNSAGESREGDLCFSPSQILCLEIIRNEETELENESQTQAYETIVNVTQPESNSLGMTAVTHPPVASSVTRDATKRQQPPFPVKSPSKLVAPLPTLFKSYFDEVPPKKL